MVASLHLATAGGILSARQPRRNQMVESVLVDAVFWCERIASHEFVFLD
jgi:hypothetical protein